LRQKVRQRSQEEKSREEMTVLARVLLVDAPWKFGDKLPGKKRGAEKHYACMSVSEIMRMPLPPIHEQAVLFFWRVSSMVEEAYQVVRAWGFVPKSEIVWNKTVQSDETGEKDALGMGRIVRGSHETYIVAARGKLLEPSSKRERTSFRAPRTKHSEKPEEFYRIIERLYPLELWPEAHVELFARRHRKGWLCFGDELPAPATNGVSVPGSAMLVRCFPIEATRHTETGWGCCHCATFNAELRERCRHCGHARCQAEEVEPRPPTLPGFTDEEWNRAYAKTLAIGEKRP